MVYWKLLNNSVATWSGYEGQVVRITHGTAKKQVRWSGSPELRSIESTNYVGLARDSTDPSITRTTLVWLTRAQTHQEHELHWSGSQEPRLIKNINYLGLARKSPDPSRRNMATSSDSVVTHSVGDQTASEELDLEDGERTPAQPAPGPSTGTTDTAFEQSLTCGCQVLERRCSRQGISR